MPETLAFNWDGPKVMYVPGLDSKSFVRLTSAIS